MFKNGWSKNRNINFDMSNLIISKTPPMSNVRFPKFWCDIVCPKPHLCWTRLSRKLGYIKMIFIFDTKFSISLSNFVYLEVFSSLEFKISRLVCIQPKQKSVFSYWLQVLISFCIYWGAFTQHICKTNYLQSLAENPAIYGYEEKVGSLVQSYHHNNVSQSLIQTCNCKKVLNQRLCMQKLVSLAVLLQMFKQLRAILLESIWGCFSTINTMICLTVSCLQEFLQCNEVSIHFVEIRLCKQNF